MGRLLRFLPLGARLVGAASVLAWRGVPGPVVLAVLVAVAMAATPVLAARLTKGTPDGLGTGASLGLLLAGAAMMWRITPVERREMFYAGSPPRSACRRWPACLVQHPPVAVQVDAARIGVQHITPGPAFPHGRRREDPALPGGPTDHRRVLAVLRYLGG